VNGRVERSSVRRHELERVSASRWPPVGHRTVLVIGGGSVGSHVAYGLAQLNYRLVVMDGELVEPSNIEGGRSAFLPETIGMHKPTALAHTLRRLGLEVEIVTLCRKTQDFTDQEIRALAAQSSAVLASFDEPEQLLRINRLLYSLCPVVYPFFHQGARSGTVVGTAPGRSPCFACSMGIRAPDQLRTLHAEPGFPPDIRRLADMAVRVISWLCAEQGSEAAELLDPSRNIIFLENRPSGSAQRALAVRLLEADRNPECDVCSVNSSSAKGR
jgi:molybdopterin/thiamine biosynthesis adenylyltransferase